MEENKDSENQIFVRFKTQLKDHSITSDPINIPAKLRRLGLSQVVNHLLGYETPVPFDFLIAGSFLRTSLGKFLERNNLTEEPIIEIEYVLALGTPDTTNSYQHEDWVSALDKNQNSKDFKMIITGSYDNIIRFWKYNNVKSPAFTLTGHTAPIKSIVTKKLQSNIFVVSASQDQTLKSWLVTPSKNKGNCVSTLVAHTGTVLSCDISIGETKGNIWEGLVASGSWDTTIKLWYLRSDGEIDEDVLEDRATKKRKIEKEGRVKKADMTLLGHKQPVSSVVWNSKDTLISGSWDYTVKFWDTESGINTESKSCNKAVECVSYSPLNQMVISSHTDNIIRLWDKRTEYSETCQGFISHSNWVSTVAFHPSNPDQFLSASYDKSIKIWDIRSSTPLHTISEPNAHTEKILTASWYDDKIFLSGAADSQLKTHQIK